MPNLFIIAGCNGAGKTTASFTLLPDLLHCKEFVNADEIARGISPFQPESVSFQAGRIMIERIDGLLNSGVDFAFETTLTTLSYIQTVHRAKEKGYRISLLFFWLNNDALAIERVKTRVNEGGHHIPEETIRRRYSRGINNLMTKFISVCDYWIIINNSGAAFTFVAEAEGQINLRIYDGLVWNQLKNRTNEKR